MISHGVYDLALHVGVPANMTRNAIALRVAVSPSYSFILDDKKYIIDPERFKETVLAYATFQKLLCDAQTSNPHSSTFGTSFFKVERWQETLYRSSLRRKGQLP